MPAQPAPPVRLLRSLVFGPMEHMLWEVVITGRQIEVEQSARDLVALLRSLDPRPGAQINPDPPDYVAPDCIAWREGGVWQVALAPGSQPRLSVNRHYEGLIAQASRSGTCVNAPAISFFRAFLAGSKP